jgi:hypothetical protein
MPFQSEKQRKYLWANEPEIARDWTEKYGSRVKKQEGGGFWKGLGIPSVNLNTLASKYVLPSSHFSSGDYDRIYNTATNTPDYHADATENLFDHLYTNYENIPYVGGAAAMGIEKLAPYIGLGASPIYDFAQAKSEYAEDPAKYQGSKWDKINAYFPDLANTNVSGILNAFDQQDPWSAMWNRARGATTGALKRKIDRQNQIQDLLKKGWGAIKNEFSGSAEAAGIPINKFQGSVNYPQSKDLEAQASGMFKEEDEDGNWFDGIRRWAGPFYNVYKGNIGGALLGSAFGPFGMLAGAFVGGKGNPMKMFNRNRPTPAQQRANQNYMNQNRITRDPQTGRMIGGNFAGLNAPGTSMFGSKTFKEMANKQIAKYGKTAPKAKVDAWKAVVTGGRDPSQGNTHTGHGKSGMGRDPSDRMAQGGLASLWPR